ncbi:sensor histidine kinase [Luteimonas terrae]|uniref:histidine kinase n=1 Tax=Luteimonas terrae TaxID=1530191 RepID=A0ABU1XXU3_9GAMM|nr:sensor histidine kinase [Luteimonas terrae]MDR7193590.1 signal transduction histidine kinase [Luteimonas terrae]
MRLADFIEENAGEILETAQAFARTQAPAGVELSAKELRNHLPQILKAIVTDMRSPQSSSAQQAKAEGRAPPQAGPESAASYHGRTRAIAGFGVNQMVAEYRALRASVLHLWSADETLSRDSIEDMVRFNEAIDQAVAESLAEYSTEVESWRQIFLGALGHDLRGPLTAVVFTADVLAEKTRDTPYARHAERILVGAERMSKLLNDLLAYSKSKLGAGMVLDRDLCDLGDVLVDEIELLRAALPGTAIRFGASGTTQGRFDASRLREALHNLVTNAAKYGDPGSDVWVDVEGDADHVRLSVRNAGATLTGDDLHAMFDPLRRGAKNASTGEHMSLGLGLFLVREIVTAHGGKVSAASADGFTTFLIALPRDA